MRHDPRLAAIEARLMLAFAQIASVTATSGDTVVYTPFNTATPSPLILQVLSPGSIISHVGVVILEAFDAAAVITVGTPTRLYLGPGDINAMHAAQYEHDAIDRFTTPDLLQATFAFNGATTGEGLVLYKIKA